MFPTNSGRLIGISDAFLPLFTGIRHLAHVLTVPPTKARLLCARPAGLDLYRPAMPVGTYRVQSPGFPKIIYFACGGSEGVKSKQSMISEAQYLHLAYRQFTKYFQVKSVCRVQVLGRGRCVNVRTGTRRTLEPHKARWTTSRRKDVT